MRTVLAKINELEKIQNMYTKIVEYMDANEIRIWNENYPNEEFEDDIKKKQLYLLKEKDNILGAFVMFEHETPEEGIEWKDQNAKAYILNRVGVNVDYLRQGNGQKIINSACKIATKKGAGYLRLLVSELNNPAIELYTKCKFNKLKGIHEAKVNENCTLNEYGFEMQLDKTSDAK